MESGSWTVREGRQELGTITFVRDEPEENHYLARWKNVSSKRFPTLEAAYQWLADSRLIR